MNFFKIKLVAIENRINSKIDPQKQGDDHYVGKREQSKEEQIVFPLALKADLL
jgi:hypothetical protein